MSAAAESVTLVPVKPVPDGKSRLAAVLDDAGRAALIAWMLGRVLDAIQTVRPGPVYVVGADAALQAVAARHGCVALPELGSNHNDTLVRAMHSTAPAGRWLIVAADLPLVESDDIRMLIGNDVSARLAPSHDGTGTNALVLPAHCAIVPQFGDQSRRRHLAALEAAGCRALEVASRGLAFDVDHPSDLDVMLAALADEERLRLSEALRGRSAGTSRTLAD